MPRGGATQPPTRDDFDRVMHTNVLGAMQAIPQVAPLVEARAAARFVFITSGMGRIAGVDSSYGWLYRASKAALNMAVAAAQPRLPAGPPSSRMQPGLGADRHGRPRRAARRWSRACPACARPSPGCTPQHRAAASSTTTAAAFDGW